MGADSYPVVADLLGHPRLDTVRAYTSPPKTTAPRPSTCSPKTVDQREQHGMS